MSTREYLARDFSRRVDDMVDGGVAEASRLFYVASATIDDERQRTP